MRRLRWELAALAAVALSVSPIGRATAPWGTCLLIVVATVLLTSRMAVARWRDPILWWMLLANLLLRSLLSITLFLISDWKLPIGQPLQLGGGFWHFAPDAVLFHEYGARIVESWRDGVELPYVGRDQWYFLVVGFAYRWWGVHILHGVFVNMILGIAASLLAYATVARLGNRTSARVAAALVAFWPSTLWWSTQLLKEQAFLFLVMVAFYGIVRFYQHVASGRLVGRDAIRCGLTALTLCGAMVGIGMTRWLYAVVLGFSMLAAFGVYALWILVRKRSVSRAGLFVAIALLALGVTFSAPAILPFRFVEPQQPWVGHFRRGLALLKSHELAGAKQELLHSIDVNPRFRPAYEQLMVILAEEGRTTEVETILANLSHCDPQRTARPIVAVAAPVPSVTQKESTESSPKPTRTPAARRLSPPVAEAAAPVRQRREAAGDPVSLSPSASTAAANIGPTRQCLQPSPQPPPKLTPAPATPVASSPLSSNRSDRVPAPAPRPEFREALQMLNAHIDVLARQQRLPEIGAALRQSEQARAGHAVSSPAAPVPVDSPPTPRAVPQVVALGNDIKSSPSKILGFLRDLRQLPANITSLRGGQKAVAKHSLLYPDVDLSSFQNIVGFLLPEGLWTIAFAPFPNEWLKPGVRTGKLRPYAAIEMGMIYVLSFFGLIGLVIVARQDRALAWFFVAYMLLGYTVLALTMVSLGNVFRYRVPFFVSVMLLASVGAGWVLSRIQERTAPSSTPPEDREWLLRRIRR